MLADQEMSAAIIDKYKMLAVVDSGRSFCNNEVSYNLRLHYLIKHSFVTVRLREYEKK